jgi:hypothetical protein
VNEFHCPRQDPAHTRAGVSFQARSGLMDVHRNGTFLRRAESEYPDE